MSASLLPHDAQIDHAEPPPHWKPSTSGGGHPHPSYSHPHSQHAHRSPTHHYQQPRIHPLHVLPNGLPGHSTTFKGGSGSSGGGGGGGSGGGGRSSSSSIASGSGRGGGSLASPNAPRMSFHWDSGNHASGAAAFNSQLGTNESGAHNPWTSPIQPHQQEQQHHQQQHHQQHQQQQQQHQHQQAQQHQHLPHTHQQSQGSYAGQRPAATAGNAAVYPPEYDRAYTLVSVPPGGGVAGSTESRGGASAGGGYPTSAYDAASRSSAGANQGGGGGSEPFVRAALPSPGARQALDSLVYPGQLGQQQQHGQQQQSSPPPPPPSSLAAPQHFQQQSPSMHGPSQPLDSVYAQHHYGSSGAWSAQPPLHYRSQQPSSQPYGATVPSHHQPLQSASAQPGHPQQQYTVPSQAARRTSLTGSSAAYGGSSSAPSSGFLSSYGGGSGGLGAGGASGGQGAAYGASFHSAATFPPSSSAVGGSHAGYTSASSSSSSSATNAGWLPYPSSATSTTSAPSPFAHMSSSGSLYHATPAGNVDGGSGGGGAPLSATSQTSSSFGGSADPATTTTTAGHYLGSANSSSSLSSYAGGGGGGADVYSRKPVFEASPIALSHPHPGRGGGGLGLTTTTTARPSRGGGAAGGKAGAGVNLGGSASGSLFSPRTPMRPTGLAGFAPLPEGPTSSGAVVPSSYGVVVGGGGGGHTASPSTTIPASSSASSLHSSFREPLDAYLGGGAAVVGVGARHHAGASHEYDDDEEKWLAVCGHSHAADRYFVYGAMTTRIYCRPSCASKRPERNRVRFFTFPGAAEKAERAGFRACKRCKPGTMETADQCVLAVGDCVRHITRSADFMASEGAEADLKRKTLKEYAARAGLSAFHFHRSFKAVSSLTPGEYAKACHALALQDSIGKDGNNGATISADGLARALQGWSARRARRAIGGILPSAYAAGMNELNVQLTTAHSTPFGVVSILYTEAGDEEGNGTLFGVALGPHAERQLLQRAPRAVRRQDRELWLAGIVGELYRRGEREVQLPIEVIPSVRRARVWSAVKSALGKRSDDGDRDSFDL